MKTTIGSLEAIRRDLRSHADPARAQSSKRFFKTGPGQYGEGDVFIGVIVPDQRKIARTHKDLPLAAAIELLHSPVHEERLTALFILVAQYRKADPGTRQTICDLYLKNIAYVNNWDLVDSSAPYIVGPELDRLGPAALHRLATSDLIWDRRIAILATFHDIKTDRYDRALATAETLLADPHDLMHKAVGWMLREVGNKDRSIEEAFLAKRYHTMPRTMLRYAIEKFPPHIRTAYLNGTA